MKRKRSELEKVSRRRLVEVAKLLGYAAVTVYVRKTYGADQAFYVAGIVASGDVVREGRPAVSQGRACELLVQDLRDAGFGWAVDAEGERKNADQAGT